MTRPPIRLDEGECEESQSDGHRTGEPLTNALRERPAGPFDPPTGIRRFDLFAQRVGAGALVDDRVEIRGGEVTIAGDQQRLRAELAEALSEGGPCLVDPGPLEAVSGQSRVVVRTGGAVGVRAP